MDDSRKNSSGKALPTSTSVVTSLSELSTPENEVVEEATSPPLVEVTLGGHSFPFPLPKALDSGYIVSIQNRVNENLDAIREEYPEFSEVTAFGALTMHYAERLYRITVKQNYQKEQLAIERDKVSQLSEENVRLSESVEVLVAQLEEKEALVRKREAALNTALQALRDNELDTAERQRHVVSEIDRVIATIDEARSDIFWQNDAPHTPDDDSDDGLVTQEIARPSDFFDE